MNQTEEKNFEKLSGIVGRVTFHNSENGWSVLRVEPLNRSGEQVTVTIHQSKVFAGATMDFYGHWANHPKFGQQFKAIKVVEKKPATASALEKYLGSGLIYGVGPKTAKKIVKHFGAGTLDVFEKRIDSLMEIRGIAEEKLKKIKSCWQEHQEIRNVMMFLQTYGISTLFAVKIYKTYGDQAIEIVKSNPYRLSKDIYGIGFFSADKVALNLGFKEDSEERISAAIKHVLSCSRDEGHCYLTFQQIHENVESLLGLERSLLENIQKALEKMAETDEVKVRDLKIYSGKGAGKEEKCYYSKSLFFDEIYVSKKILQLRSCPIEVDLGRVEDWIDRYCAKFAVSLSEEQRQSVVHISGESFSILTGGPGCGKTTTTKILVKLLLSMQKRVILAAPTGRAAQRMSEVIGLPAQTIHRLLVWSPQNGRFKKNEENPLEGDFLIVDECSMLDISLSASLLKAVAEGCQVLFIGDADQLPSVGAGNVLRDLITSESLSCFHLTKIFRQAEESLIIQYAHQINKGQIPKIESPIHRPEMWTDKKDCFFIDSEETTLEQARFIAKAKQVLSKVLLTKEDSLVQKTDKKGIEHLEIIASDERDELYFENFDQGDIESNMLNFMKPDLIIPKKYSHVDLQQLLKVDGEVDHLKAILKKIHPWSSLHYGLTASEIIRKIYVETIPRYFGPNMEVQVLSPMVRGSLGAHQLNTNIQNAVNPFQEGKGQIKLGERFFRQGDRVIQKRNNYDLGVFNGDIGHIKEINAIDMQLIIEFGVKEDKKEVIYEKENLTELDLAYSITIHKSQGSEFDIVIIPIMTQHFKMLFRNLVYTGLTRAKKLTIFIGTRKAMSMAVRNFDARVRQTALKFLLQKGSRN